MIVSSLTILGNLGLIHSENSNEFNYRFSLPFLPLTYDKGSRGGELGCPGPNLTRTQSGLRGRKARSCKGSKHGMLI